MKRSTVVYTHDHLFAIFQVGNLDIGWQRQTGMRGRHGVHVIGLAAGSAPAMEFFAIPRSNATFGKALARGQRVVALAEYCIGRWIAVATAWLSLGDRVGGQPA